MTKTRNKNISKTQLDQLLSAIKTQVSPQNLHFYSYGEPKRLAMAFIYIVLRGEHTEREISSFFDNFYKNSIVNMFLVSNCVRSTFLQERIISDKISVQF